MEERKEAKVWQELVIWQTPYQAFSQMSSPFSHESYKVGIVIILILFVGTLRLKKKAQLLNGRSNSKATGLEKRRRLIPQILGDRCTAGGKGKRGI